MLKLKQNIGRLLINWNECANEKPAFLNLCHLSIKVTAMGWHEQGHKIYSSA